MGLYASKKEEPEPMFRSATAPKGEIQLQLAKL